MTMTWDYLIIGAGSAGCAAAHALASSGRNRVLVLEAGGSDRSPYIKVPAGVLRACENYDWGYESQPDVTRRGAKEHWLRGRVLGGSSSINGMVFVRGAACDFDRWAAQLCHRGGWSAEQVLPIFRELETSDQRSVFRGGHGPLAVTTVKRPHAITEAFVRSASAAGYPFNEDYNGHTQEGVAYTQRTIRGGFRCSAADAFLKPLLGRENLKLLLNATVERLEISKGRVVAVSFSHHGKRCRESAREVIVCTGAINSPQLLMLSGIGDAGELQRLGIDPVVDQPAVGQNLKEQPMVRLVYRSKIETYNLTGGLTQRLSLLAKFLRHREGPISSAFEGAAFLKTDPEQPVPDIQLLMFPFGSSCLADGTYALTAYPGLTIYVIHSYPQSSGRIRLASADPRSAPLIECRLLGAQADVDTLVGGMETVRRIMRTDPIASLTEEVTPGLTRDPEALREYVRDHTEITFHPTGTCRMGIGANAVVDPDLRVRGVENLWIADASIIPEHLSANINAVCMMIGRKLGKELAARTA